MPFRNSLNLLSTVVLLSWFTPKSVAATSLISEVVGIVGEQIVTSREVAIGSVLERILYPNSKMNLDLGTSANPSSGNDFETGAQRAERALIEWSVYMEALNFKAVSASDTEIRAAQADVVERVRDPEFANLWAAFEVSTKELERMVNRKVRARKFIDFKLNASRVSVTDAEALTYFQKNKSRFGDRPFSQFKDTIKGFLSQQQADRRIKDWFGALKKKYNVKVLVSGA